jgi:hypothetical protein
MRKLPLWDDKHRVDLLSLYPVSQQVYPEEVLLYLILYPLHPPPTSH